jgi:hypothetical protein
MVNARRAEVHELIEQLQKDDLEAAKRYLEYLRDMGDPFLKKLREAPVDDEPETADERKRVEKANADLAAGRTLSTKALKKKLGL